MNENDEAPEVIIATIEGGEDDGEPTRQLRVYDRAKGDFLIEIPIESKVTFGYFNPAASGMRGDGFGGHGMQTMKTTALRIYERGEKSNQLACFLGVDGFRDMDIRLTRLRQRVTIESNFEDDGLGNVDQHAKERRAIVAAAEDEVF